MKRMNFIAIIMCMFVSCTTSQKVNNETVSSLDLRKYLGGWYEIARFDHYFERGMEQTKTFYELRDEGKVTVSNFGVKDGELKAKYGVAKTTGNPALLRVSFFGPFYADYRVLYVDTAYQYALVGGGNSNYLWILSRTPRLEERAKNVLLSEASIRGYDISKLIWVDQRVE